METNPEITSFSPRGRLLNALSWPYNTGKLSIETHQKFFKQCQELVLYASDHTYSCSICYRSAYLEDTGSCDTYKKLRQSIQFFEDPFRIAKEEWPLYLNQLFRIPHIGPELTSFIAECIREVEAYDRKNIG